MEKNPKKFDKKERKDGSKYIELNPEDDSGGYSEVPISEQKSNTIVFTFGRFNPPTMGHEKIVEKMKTMGRGFNADLKIFTSHSTDTKKNPLVYSDKIKYLNLAFGSIVQESKARTPIEVLKELDGKYSDIIFVVGSDRLAEFDTLFNKYNGIEYNFNSITVVSGGQRDPDAETTEGISASKLRGYALLDNFELFKLGLPKTLQQKANELYKDIRKGLGLMETYMPEEIGEDKQPLNQQQRRKRAMVARRNKVKLRIGRERAERRMASPEKLKARAQRKARGLIRDRLMKSKKYSEMSPAEKIALDKRLMRIPKSVLQRIAVKQLPIVRKAEIQRLSDFRKGSVEKNENYELNSLFEQFINEPKEGRKKKFRYLYTKEGKVNYDGRFKMFRPKVTESLEEDLFDLIESVETFIEGDAYDRAKSAIESEKKADMIRHKSMLNRAKAADKQKNESVNKNDPRNREYGTNSLVKILKGDTPKQSLKERLKKTKGDPCWNGYTQLGMKKKNGNEVPNCIPVNEAFEKHFDFYIVEDSTVCPIITFSQMKTFEEIVDKLFAKFNIDFNFTKHFRERMSHERNNPCITLRELGEMIKKIYAKYQHGEKSLSKFVDAEVVIKDIQKDLNMPIAVEYDRNKDELDVIAKTIMRKKNFSTPNPVVRV